MCIVRRVWQRYCVALASVLTGTDVVGTSISANAADSLEVGEMFWISDNSLFPHAECRRPQLAKVEDNKLVLVGDYGTRISIHLVDILQIELQDEALAGTIGCGPKVCITYWHDWEGLLLYLYLVRTECSRMDLQQWMRSLERRWKAVVSASRDD